MLSLIHEICLYFLVGTTNATGTIWDAIKGALWLSVRTKSYESELQEHIYVEVLSQPCCNSDSSP